MSGEIDEASVKQCEKCAAPKIKISGILKCVNCSTLVEKESDFRNNVVDPGHETMMRVLNSPVGSQVPEVAEVIPDGISIKNRTPVLKAALNGEVTADNVNQAIETISKFFAKRPVSDLAEAKRLIKLRKEIENLQAKILVFLGGN